jgi:hypothetical protein
VNFEFDWDYENSGVPYVTINESSISFNQRSIELLHSAPRIEIGFDKANLALGFRAIQESESNRGHKFVGKDRERKWFRVGCKDFVKSLAQIADISFKPARRIIAQLDDSTGVLFVQLKSNAGEKSVATLASTPGNQESVDSMPSSLDNSEGRPYE